MNAIRRTAPAIISLWLLCGCAAYPGAAHAAAPTVVLERPIRFLRLDAGEVLAPPGRYDVDEADGPGIRLLAEGRAPIVIPAARLRIDATATDPMAMTVMEEGEEDQVHVVLVLPDGRAFDATGFSSGITPRAAIVPALTSAQVQTAVGQSKPSVVPSGAMVRVPAAAGPLASLPVSKTVQSTPSERVSWDFIRMQRPELIAAVLRDVQIGKRDPHTLAGLASSDRISALLKQNYDALLNPMSFGQADTRNRWAEILNPNIKTDLAPVGGLPALAMKGSALAQPVIAAHVPPPDYSPLQLSLGSAYSGQTRRGTVHVIAPVDSVVVASVPSDGKPFRIVKASALSGRLVSAPYILPSGQVTQTIVQRYEESAVATTPPYQLAVRSGQKIEYQVVFEPHMDLFTGNPIGDYRTSLQVASDHAWFADVPITATFNGIAIGVIGTMDDNAITAIYDGTPCNRSVLVPASMTFINADQQLRAVSVSLRSASSILQMQPFTVSLGPGERKQVAMPLQRQACMEEGVEYTASIQYTYPGVDRHADFGVTVYPSQLHWSHAADDVGSCHYLWDIFAHSNGDTAYYLEFQNMNLVSSMQLDVSFFALGQGMGTDTFQDGPNVAGVVKTHGYTIPWSFVRENYTRLFGAPVQANLHCHQRGSP